MRDAVEACRAIVASEPGNADAWHLLGIAENQRGCQAEAERCLRRAIALAPQNPQFHCNLGLVLVVSARLDEALGQFRRAAQVDPQYVAAYTYIAATLEALDRQEEAAIYYRKAVTLAAGSADVWLRAGIGLARLGHLEEAERFYRRSLEIAPRSAAALYNLGNALRDRQKLGEAERAYRDAVALAPDFAEAFSNLALVVCELGDAVQAEALCARALELNPRLHTAEYNLGGILKRQGRVDEAIACYRRALAVAPDFADAHINLGYLLMERAIEQAGGARPDLSEARESYERALAANPAHAEVHVNLALLHLLEGDFERGWAEFEWRWQTKHAVRPESTSPLWNGEPLAGRTILLRAEQGFGDTIQFARFAPLVKARGATVIGMCPPELRRILEGSRGVDRWITIRDAVPPFDFHAPLMSLPRILQTTPDTIPSPVPYLEADPPLVERWRAELDAYRGFRVGIVWRGNPAHRRDVFRSMPLSAFEALAAVDGVRLFSLQKGGGRDELGAARFPIVDLGARLDDFADTAALVEALDLVIGCDTSVVHLAGALGRPAWVMLPVVPDWRWSLDRSDTPWYPTLRLYRQRRAGDWTEPVRAAAAALARRGKKTAQVPADLR